MIESLIKGLVEQGVKVELFANGHRRMKGVPTHSYYKQELFEKIDMPYYDAPLQIMQTHLHYALRYIDKAGDFDIIHDHNPIIGPTYWSLASRIRGIPPVVHTFHGPPFSTPEMLDEGRMDNRPPLELLKSKRLFGVCISDALKSMAPGGLKKRLLPSVHNAIDIDSFPFKEKKENYYITLARFTPDKGQHIAAEFAKQYKKRLRMAGTIAGIGSNRKLMFELSNPNSTYRQSREFAYYSNKILPYVFEHPRITYAGNLSGQRKLQFLSNAKALLFPIQWEEPFGMSVIEALACGTPVVAMRRGAMPEIIQHGVNGFLADTVEEFYEYANRVDEISPADCRKSVEDQFSMKAMATAYIDRYQQAIDKAIYED